MLATLFVVILISFIGVGLPDSVLGTAWPIMYREFELPVSMAGYISMAVSVGTILSSLLSTRLIHRFGTGLVTAVSTLLTAVALLGFSMTSQPVFFFLLAIPLGLGAGAVDTGLNSFVALHYSAAQMSFLHCFYGVGVAVSPLIMSWALGDGGDWRRGYFTVALLQGLITVVAFVALPLWRRMQKKDAEEQNAPPRMLGIVEMFRIPGVAFSCFAFFFSCALELTAGAWSSTYFVNIRGIPADRAATLTMLFYVGLTLGRLLSGIFSTKLGRRRILRISLYTLITSVALFLLPLPTPVSAAALFGIGLAIGPTYPNLVHLTPKNFGEDIAQSVMGLQQAMTYVGILIMPWFFGILADAFSAVLLPYYLLAMLICYTSAFLLLMHTVKKRRTGGK